jgi:hypothetical protein
MRVTTAPLLLLAASLLTLGGCEAEPSARAAAPVPVVETTPPPLPPKPAPDPRVDTVAGHRVVHLYGSPADMGRQMGELLGDDIRYLIESYLPNIPGARAREAEAVARAEEIAEFIPANQLEETRATAAAAGVRYDHMLVASCIIELYEETLCAGVGAWGDAAEHGETIVGRNLDWYDTADLHEYGMLIVRHPDAGRAFLSLGFPGLPGVVTGMNADGLFVADLVQMPTDGKRAPSAHDGVPVMALQRLVLERCTTVDDAIELMRTTSRTVPQNYLLADAARAAFLETDARRFVEREPMGETVVGTNYAGEKRRERVFDPRFGSICWALDRAPGAVDVATVEKALGLANLGKLSVQSVIAVPARRFLRVSMGTIPACKGPFVDIDAGPLLEDVR